MFILDQNEKEEFQHSKPTAGMYWDSGRPNKEQMPRDPKPPRPPLHLTRHHHHLELHRAPPGGAAAGWCLHVSALHAVHASASPPSLPNRDLLFASAASNPRKAACRWSRWSHRRVRSFEACFSCAARLLSPAGPPPPRATLSDRAEFAPLCSSVLRTRPVCPRTTW